jgi:hypothetical protein
MIPVEKMTTVTRINNYFPLSSFSMLQYDSYQRLIIQEKEKEQVRFWSHPLGGDLVLKKLSP